MKLEKFKEEKKKQKSIILFTIACVLLITGVLIYKTFASFQVIENEDMINGDVSDPGDIYFAFYKNGEITKEIPSSEEGNFFLDENASYCGVLETKDENIKLSFNSETRDITITGAHTTHTKCYLYFRDQYHVKIDEEQKEVKVSDGTLSLDKKTDGKIFMCNNGVNIKEENSQIKIENITKDTKCNYYNTSSEALQAVDNTPNYMFFLADETANNSLEISDEKEITMDINGHTNEYNGRIDNEGNLTICSSNQNKGNLNFQVTASLIAGPKKTYIKNCKLTSNIYSGSTIYMKDSLLLKIENSEIIGFYGVGGNGGNLFVDNSKIEATEKRAIQANASTNFSNVIIKNKSVIIGKENGIALYSGGNVILDGDEKNYPTITGSIGTAIYLSFTSSNLYFKYGETYGIEENTNEGTTYLRNGATLKEVIEDGKTHTYLE